MADVQEQIEWGMRGEDRNWLSSRDWAGGERVGLGCAFCRPAEYYSLYLDAVGVTVHVHIRKKVEYLQTTLPEYCLAQKIESSAMVKHDQVDSGRMTL